jgi:hypothetical protein
VKTSIKRTLSIGLASVVALGATGAQAYAGETAPHRVVVVSDVAPVSTPAPAPVPHLHRSPVVQTTATVPSRVRPANAALASWSS